jgi:hypothetical protein
MLDDGYRGVNIQLKYYFESDQITLFCDTYTNGSVTARIGFSIDPDLHEKLLRRIGSRWCKKP